MRTLIAAALVFAACQTAFAAFDRHAEIHDLCEPGAGYTAEKVAACTKDLLSCPIQTEDGIWKCAHNKGYPAAEGDDEDAGGDF